MTHNERSRPVKVALSLMRGGRHGSHELPGIGADLQIVLHYQPKADLVTGEIAGVEALVRWLHPQHGLISPDMFIPFAEKTGLIKSLTLQVIDEAVRQCREWLEAGLELPVAVNLSVENLHDLRLAEDVEATLDRWRLPASHLEFEITESGLVANPERSAEVLKRLTSLGVRIAVDDFGAGHSSLLRLQQLPVSQVKIDRSFVTRLVEDDSNAAIIQSIVELASALGLTVVAEGVEDEASWDRLRTLGCHQAQGFFLTQALSAPDLVAWLDTWTAPSSAEPTAPPEPRGRSWTNGKVVRVPPPVTRVFVVEDHMLVRQSLVRAIRAEPGFEVAGDAGSVAEALERIFHERPEILLLDIELPDGTGIDLAEQVLRTNPGTRVVFLTMRDDEATVRRALEAGADGYLPKTSSTEDLLEAVKAVANGGSYLGRDIARRVMNLASGRNGQRPNESQTLQAKGGEL